MKIGAVIAAAGMSTRMKDFKQLMKIGNLTMAERVVLNFQRAGIKDIVMITGFQGKLLEKSLHHYGITFLRNEDYETTQMLDSVKIGLEYLKDRCEQILFCPVDASAFSMKTLEELLTHEEDWIYPFCNGRIGHPILIANHLLPRILAHTGGGGLKGALDSLGISPVVMEVTDAGSVMDADTPEDYKMMKEYLAKGE